MPNPDANRWNKRYLSESDFWSELDPSRLLLKFTNLLPPRGVALDAACGMGRNGLYLAKRGLSVIYLDISEIALLHLVQRLRHENLPPSAAVYDISNLWLPDDFFEVVMNFRFLDRNSFGLYRRCLKPGGILFFETFLKNANNPPNPDYYLESGELLREFDQFDIIHAEEKKITKKGEHTSKWIAQLVAKKPH